RMTPASAAARTTRTLPDSRLHERVADTVRAASEVAISSRQHSEQRVSLRVLGREYSCESTRYLLWVDAPADGCRYVGGTPTTHRRSRVQCAGPAPGGGGPRLAPVQRSPMGVVGLQSIVTMAVPRGTPIRE